MRIRFGPGDVPAALRGERPRWWFEDDWPILAWGPFIVEERGFGFRVGACLRVQPLDLPPPGVEAPTDVWQYLDRADERGHWLKLTGEPVARGDVIALRSAVHDGPIVIRPIRDGDRRLLHLADDTDASRPFVDVVRASLDW